MIALTHRGILLAVVGVLVCVAIQMGSSGHTGPPPPGAIVLDSSLVSESSGLARSGRDDQLLWTHNDSGDSPRMFAFTRQGELWATLTLQDAKAIDWEDMCSFTRDGKSWLAVADVGDNGTSRKHVTIYLTEEPIVSNPDSPLKSGKFATRMTSKVQVEVQVRYPDGPQNCEAIAYDPWRQQFILASKERFRSRIYAVDFDLVRRKQESTARHMGTVTLPLVTGAAISDDGRLLALATYGPTCLLRRDSKVDWEAASVEERREAVWNLSGSSEMELIPAPPRRQGEAVCFDKHGKQILMTSEGSPMPLWSVDVDAR